MQSGSRHPEAKYAPLRDMARHAYTVGLISTVALAAAFGLSAVVPAQDAGAEPAPVSAGQAADSYALILDALLAPTLKADAVPLRWSDPRAALRCGPHTAIRVNRLPLVSGDLVPDTPFEIEWHADGCRLPGAAAARVDGWVKVTVFREDWGMSAMV
jgi:hypothetical protein